MRTLTALTLLLGACAPSADDAATWAEVLPDDRVRIGLPAADGLRGVGEPSAYHALSVDVVDGVNALIDDVLTDVAYITSFEPTWADEDARVAQWGPWQDDELHDTRLWVTRDDDGTTTWGADLRPIGEGDDAWVTLVAGEVGAGATRRTNEGRFAIDYTGIADRVPDETTRGEFYVEYAVDGDVAEATAGYVDFAGGADDPPIDAAYRYTADGAGGGSVDIAAEQELTGEPALELLVIRTRWVEGGAGRSDALATDGDLGALVYQASECWDSAFTVVFHEDNFDLARGGDEGACAFGEASWPE